MIAPALLDVVLEMANEQATTLAGSLALRLEAVA